MDRTYKIVGSAAPDADKNPARTPTPSKPVGGRVIALLGVILISLNLRAAATAVTPILKIIESSFTVGPTAQSLLGTLPLLCFAVFGIATPRVVRKLGLEKTLVLAALLIAAGEFARATFSQSSTGLILFSIVCLGGMGMSNVLVIAAIKHYFPDRLGPVNGMFQVLIVVSGSFPSFIAVQTTEAIGWRPFVGSWGILAVAALVPWLMLWNGKGDHAATAKRPAMHLLRSPVAWGVMLVFSSGSMLLYALIAWLPTMLTETRGVSTKTAAQMLSIFNFIGLFHSFVVPNILGRMKHPFLVIAAAAAFTVAGSLGLAYAPGSAWPWILISGLGAMSINLGLTLMTMRCRTEAGVTALSGFVQSGGYLVAAVAPLIMGALRTATGGWVASCWFLAGIGMLGLFAGLLATRPVLLDDAPSS